MKKLSKFLAIVLSLVILQTPLATVFANGDLGINMYGVSQWATEEVNMASLYSLVDGEMLRDFGASVTNEEVALLATNLYARLTGNEENDAAKSSYYVQLIEYMYDEGLDHRHFVTREEIAKALFNVIKYSAPELEINVEPVTYLIDKQIIKGRGNSTFDLNSKCNRQELFALIKRTYEYVIRETNRASKGYFYKLSGQSEVYILGSIHAADISIYPLEERIEDAFSRADYVAVEADVTNMEEAAQYIQRKALFYDGTTIDKVISTETYELYKAQIESYGIGPEVYNILKPWYAAMLLQNLSLQENSYESGLGIDMYFLARSNNKEILEIEGVQFQIDLFDNFTQDIQEMFLLDILISTENNEDDENFSSELMKYMLKVWSEGDEDELARLVSLEGAEEYSEFDELFWVERNKNMTKKIIEYLDDERAKTYFVIVGAGHLVGESGVVKELLDLGYSVNP